MQVNGKKLFVVDTEDDSKGNIYWINFYDGKNHYPFKTVDQAINFIEGQKCKTICFAVNLEYDLINVFRGHYDKIRWNFAKSRIISAKYKQMLFYDTYNHWKMSVAQMGEYIGKPKLPFNPQSLKYCQGDCETTYLFVIKMLKIYNRLDFNCRSTLPSTVYDFWKRTYCPFKLGRIEDKTLDIYKQAYYGGRCDCFYVGKLKGVIHTVDINSLYPFVMQREYPNPYEAEKRYSIKDFGITYASVEVNSDLPVLPYRDNKGKLIYPNGRFKGWWTNDELREAILNGAKILKVHKSYTFPYSCYPFETFIKDFYEKRMKVKKDVLLNMQYKISMNSLYGKFGQGNEKTEIMSHYDFVKQNRKLNSDNITRFGNLVIYSHVDRYPINTNMIWALYTTSYARLYLYKWLKYVKDKGGRLLYCDTDSIFYESRKPLIEYSNVLGGFKDEGIYNDIEIKLPKMYKLGNELQLKIKTKGVPKKEQENFFKNGVCYYQKPLKLKEALRRDLTPNMWIDYSKTNNLKYDKGVIGKNGEITPFKINVL